MAQIINLNTVAEVQETAKKTAENAMPKVSFEKLMESIEQINPALGGFDELAVLLSMPDEQFSVIAPIFLDELEKAYNNTEDKLIIAQALNAENIKLEDLQESLLQLSENIDTYFKDIMSQPKRDFLKRMLGITYNSFADTYAISKRVINVPIELCGENAKLPKYAHLGDGAVDLYSPEDYTINPGETIIIPCDIKVALPYGYALLIHPRSGTSAKTKLRVANSIGLVDSQYKGNIGVIVENIEPRVKDIETEYDDNGNLIIKSIEYGKPYYIGKGERFAQMRLVEVPTINWIPVETVENIGDDRGGGFGSSGKL